MISSDDSLFTYEYSQYYKILPQIHAWDEDSIRIKDGVKVPEGFIYSSENNTDWMTKTDIKKWINSNINHMDKN